VQFELSGGIVARWHGGSLAGSPATLGHGIGQTSAPVAWFGHRSWQGGRWPGHQETRGTIMQASSDAAALQSSPCPPC